MAILHTTLETASDGQAKYLILDDDVYCVSMTVLPAGGAAGVVYVTDSSPDQLQTDITAAVWIPWSQGSTTTTKADWVVPGLALKLVQSGAGTVKMLVVQHFQRR